MWEFGKRKPSLGWDAAGQIVRSRFAVAELYHATLCRSPGGSFFQQVSVFPSLLQLEWDGGNNDDNPPPQVPLTTTSQPKSDLAPMFPSPSRP